MKSRICLLLCAALLHAGCMKNVPVANPAEGARIEWLRLDNGRMYHVPSRSIARWSAEGIVIRDEKGEVTHEFARSQVHEVGVQKVSAPRVLLGGLLLGSVVLLMVGGSLDAYSGDGNSS